MTDLAQPNASQMPRELLDAVLDSIPTGGGSDPQDVVFRDQHSNDFAEIRLGNGRALIVKRGRHDWAEPRFATSRIASRLIRDRTEVAVPAPLPVPDNLDERPVEAYWRLDQPTLEEVWPDLDEERRGQALRSWGDLIGRLHSVRLDGFGPLSDNEATARSLEEYLHAELEDRLLPAIGVEWPAALPAVHRLVRWIDEAVARAGDRSCLVHNDMHMGNVLCEVTDDEVHCTGLIDLETALSAPPEADFAVMEVQHGGLFSRPLDRASMEKVHKGYSGRLDPELIKFYRAFHLINMGFYSALIGHEWHAQQVAAEATRETAKLSDPTPALIMKTGTD